MMPPCKLKFRRLYFIFCKFYMADWGFGREPFLSYEKKPQHQLGNCLYYTPFGALRCKRFRIANVRETDTPKATYMVQAICQAWNQSRVSICVRSVGAASSEHCRNTKRVHVRG